MKVRELVGSRAGGRWGPTQLFPVLYLGRPIDSVTAEAYRHLVDGTEGMRGSNVGPRRVWTCAVSLGQVLDLRIESNRLRLNVSISDLQTDPSDYLKCQQIAVAAHQLEFQAILAPSASGLGETLAVFDQHVSIEDYPRATSQEVWQSLPDDPRRKSAESRSDAGSS